jgi:hypothetical protein
MSKLVKFASAAAALVCFVVPAQSQQFQDEAAVVDACTVVALAEISDIDTVSVRGQCISATQAYLTAISSRGLSVGEFDQAISNLVIVLAGILFTPECVIESEVAKAIALANSASNDPQQRAQIRLVYDTVNECDFVITAAFFTPNAVSATTGSGPSGLLASDN